MNKYDEYLAFNLPEGYFAIEGIDDDGKPYFNVNSGKGVNDDGEDTYDYSLWVGREELSESPFTGGNTSKVPGFSLNGNVDNHIMIISKEMSLAIFTVNAMEIEIWIKDKNHVYLFRSRRVCQPGKNEELEKWIKHIDTVISSAEIAGKNIILNGLTTDKILEECRDLDELVAQNSDIPYAKPADGQHTHLDFLNKTKAGMSMLGGLFSVNASGTEYSFLQISEMVNMGDSSELGSIYKEISNAQINEFDLVETAHDMAELFRVNVEVFDGGHDREQEILGGYIQRAALYNKFRSFAWTFAAFCDKEKMDPASVDFNIIQEIVEFIESRDGLNYTADSFSPTLCSGDDLHVYYIPDSVSDKTKIKLKKIANANVEDDDAVQVSEVRSLDGLRKELDYMYPAIKAIYDELEANRDRDEALIDGVSDILYAWCSMTYAARGPIYTEDGPMNCCWEHPDNSEDWETKWKIEQLEDGIKQEKEWIKLHNKDISKNTSITFKDKIFVFTGVEGIDEWVDILQKLTNLGGVERRDVSGKTNYLVCNPMYAGESKFKHALEQRIKGNDVKIVLFDDFLKAIKMTVKTPQEQLAELKKTTEKKIIEKHLRPVVRPEIVGQMKKTEKFTYEKGIVASGEGYSFELPDDFVIKVGEEDRDFIAYIPNKDDPDNYLSSHFVIYAGQKQENDAIKQFRIPAEFAAIIKGMSGNFASQFTKHWDMRYLREDLPGAIVFGFNPEVLHVEALFGVDEHIQTMRMQIDGVTRIKRANYEKIVVELFDHMKANKPVQILEKLDAKDFVSMEMNSTLVSKWIDTVFEYINHIDVAKKMEINGIVSIFKQQQENGNENVPKLKKDIKISIRDASQNAENILVKAESLYFLKCAQYPQEPRLIKMKEAIDSIIEFTSQKVNLNDEHIEVFSEYAKEVKSRMKGNARDSIAAILNSKENQLSNELVFAMREVSSKYYNMENSQNIGPLETFDEYNYDEWEDDNDYQTSSYDVYSAENESSFINKSKSAKDEIEAKISKADSMKQMEDIEKELSKLSGQELKAVQYYCRKKRADIYKKEKVGNNNKKIEDIQKEKDKLNNNIKNKEKEKKDYYKSNSVIKDRKQITDSNAIIANKKTESENLDGMILSKEEELKNTFFLNISKKNNLKKEISDMRSQKDNLLDEIGQKERKVKQIEDKINRGEEEIKKYIKELRISLKKLEVDEKKYKEEISRLNKMASDNLIDECEEAGYLVMGTVERKYEKAFETIEQLKLNKCEKEAIFKSFKVLKENGPCTITEISIKGNILSEEGLPYSTSKMTSILRSCDLFETERTGKQAKYKLK